MIKTGQQLGNFLIKRKIKSGGMGDLFFAIDTMLNRKVALKVIHQNLAKNSELMSKFKNEARTQAQMNHPNIVTIFCLNIFNDQYVLTMEFISGKSVEELLEAKKMFSIKEALFLWKQILRGLQYAHIRNIIHGDIKPSNIMVSKYNEIKISDFGIAKILGTNTDSIFEIPYGTPRYSSPEQILGQKIDFRSDIYSAGITFYEMVTGNVPFDSEKNIDIEIERAHLESPPPKPSIFNKKINANLEKFLIKTIEKKPENRYQSVREMLEKLDNFDYK